MRIDLRIEAVEHGAVGTEGLTQEVVEVVQEVLRHEGGAVRVAHSDGVAGALGGGHAQGVGEVGGEALPLPRGGGDGEGRGVRQEKEWGRQKGRRTESGRRGSSRCQRRAEGAVQQAVVQQAVEGDRIGEGDRRRVLWTGELWGGRRLEGRSQRRGVQGKGLEQMGSGR